MGSLCCSHQCQTAHLLGLVSWYYIHYCYPPVYLNYYFDIREHLCLHWQEEECDFWEFFRIQKDVLVWNETLALIYVYGCMFLVNLATPICLRRDWHYHPSKKMHMFNLCVSLCFVLCASRFSSPHFKDSGLPGFPIIFLVLFPKAINGNEV